MSLKPSHEVKKGNPANIVGGRGRGRGGRGPQKSVQSPQQRNKQNNNENESAGKKPQVNNNVTSTPNTPSSQSQQHTNKDKDKDKERERERDRQHQQTPNAVPQSVHVQVQNERKETTVASNGTSTSNNLNHTTPSHALPQGPTSGAHPSPSPSSHIQGQSGHGPSQVGNGIERPSPASVPPVSISERGAGSAFAPAFHPSSTTTNETTPHINTETIGASVGRTRSAPPDLQEQQQAFNPNRFIPTKSFEPPQQYYQNPYAGSYRYLPSSQGMGYSFDQTIHEHNRYPSFTPMVNTRPYIPQNYHHQPHYAQGLQYYSSNTAVPQSKPQPAQREKKMLAIIDPDTNQEVDLKGIGQASALKTNTPSFGGPKFNPKPGRGGKMSNATVQIMSKDKDSNREGQTNKETIAEATGAFDIRFKNENLANIPEKEEDAKASEEMKAEEAKQENSAKHPETHESVEESKKETESKDDKELLKESNDEIKTEQELVEPVVEESSKAEGFDATESDKEESKEDNEEKENSEVEENTIVEDNGETETEAVKSVEGDQNKNENLETGETDEESVDTIEGKDDNAEENPNDLIENEEDDDDEDDEDGSWENKGEDELADAALEGSKARENAQKIVYDTSGWSPLNPNGKRIYSKDFLLQFKELFVNLPTDMKDNIKSIKDIVPGETIEEDSSKRGPRIPTRGRGPSRGGLNQSSKSLNKSGDTWSKGKGERSRDNLNSSRGGRSTTTPRKGGKGGRGDRGDRDKGKSSDSFMPLSLPATEGRWVRPQETADELENLKRDIQNILNKFTVDKFNYFCEKLVKIEIKNTDSLDLLIKLIFEKAVSEPNYCVMYADMCKFVANSQSQSKETNNLDFKKSLLNRCQKAFQQKLKTPTIGPEVTNPEDRLILEEQAAKNRIHNLGTIKFIGELFKKKMLTESIMHRCLTTLLGKENEKISEEKEEDLEHFCQLMTSIGKLIDTEKGQKLMNAYFDRINKLVNDKDLVPRIRYAFMDIIELKKRAWVPRHEKGGPKTIQEVHEDAAKAEQDKQQKQRELERKQVQSQSTRGSYTPKFDSRRDSVKKNPQPVRSSTKPAPKTTVTEDGWKVRGGGGGGRGKNIPVTPDLPKRNTNKEKVETNRFLILEDSRDVHETKESPRRSPQKSPKRPEPEKIMSLEDLERKVDLLIEEYLDSEEEESAIKEVYDLHNADRQEIIRRVIEKGVEKKNSPLVRLLAAFAKDNFFKPDHFTSAFNTIMEAISDIAIDITGLAPANFGYIIANAITEKYLSKEFLVSSTKENKLPPKIFTQLILSALKTLYTLSNKNEQRVREVCNKNDIGTYLKLSSDKLNELLEKEDLKWL